SSSRRREYLIERLWRQIEFNLRLHQPPFEVANRRRGEGHLKRRHLSCVTLTIADKRETVSGHLFAGDDCRFAWRKCTFDGFAAAIPQLRLFAPTQRFGGR